MLVCEECGSSNVQVLAWIDANTNEYKGEGPNNSPENNWCEKCQSHVYLTDEEIFNKSKDED